MRRSAGVEALAVDGSMDERRFRKPCVILNPKAGSGKAKRRWAALRPVLEDQLGPVDARFTERPGHATQLAREALQGGADLVVATGGDGTLNEVVNGYFSDGHPVNANAALALVPLGTGGDFRRSANLPTSPTEAIRAIATSSPRRIDACKVQLQSRDGAAVERYCINLASFGIGGDVAVAGKDSFLTPYSGKAAFLWATAISFLRFRPKPVRMAFDGNPPGDPIGVMEVMIGNGGYTGGGMLPCPLAKLDSGYLEITVVKEVSLFEFLRAVPILYSGRIHDHPECEHYQVRKIAATSEETMLAEVDGEAVGGLPLTAEVLPSAVSFAGLEGSAEGA